MVIGAPYAPLAHRCAAAGRTNVQTLSTATFMAMYAQVSETETRCGYNPLLEDFANTSILTTGGEQVRPGLVFRAHPTHPDSCFCCFVVPTAPPTHRVKGETHVCTLLSLCLIHTRIPAPSLRCMRTASALPTSSTNY